MRQGLKFATSLTLGAIVAAGALAINQAPPSEPREPGRRDADAQNPNQVPGQPPMMPRDRWQRGPAPGAMPGAQTGPSPDEPNDNWRPVRPRRPQGAPMDDGGMQRGPDGGQRPPYPAHPGHPGAMRERGFAGPRGMRRPPFPPPMPPRPQAGDMMMDAAPGGQPQQFDQGGAPGPQRQRWRQMMPPPQPQAQDNGWQPMPGGAPDQSRPMGPRRPRAMMGPDQPNPEGDFPRGPRRDGPGMNRGRCQPPPEDGPMQPPLQRQRRRPFPPPPPQFQGGPSHGMMPGPRGPSASGGPFSDYFFDGFEQPPPPPMMPGNDDAPGMWPGDEGPPPLDPSMYENPDLQQIPGG